MWRTGECHDETYAAIRSHNSCRWLFFLFKKIFHESYPMHIPKNWRHNLQKNLSSPRSETILPIQTRVSNFLYSQVSTKFIGRWKYSVSLLRNNSKQSIVTSSQGCFLHLLANVAHIGHTTLPLICAVQHFLICLPWQVTYVLSFSQYYFVKFLHRFCTQYFIIVNEGADCRN